jgi:two-component system OmpR family response regulator/two-component system alkaline phosphatase synthesis response regulator PhoP
MAANPGFDTCTRPPTWLVLADDGPALELDRRAPAAARIRTVADPIAFLDLLQDGRPRIAIVATPPAGSQEVDLVARERRRRSSLRAIHLSPSADLSGRLDALRQGFDEALPHTVDPQELADRAALLEERARGRGTALEVADGFELDLVAHALRRDGRAVHLRPKEFQLLSTLAANPGRAFSRRQLLDRVWGTDQVGDPRTVDVHVRWLRAKLERHPDRPEHLVTVRGVGYRLDPPNR